MNIKVENIESCFLGLAIGDALGVPVEFRSRSFLRSNPIKFMTGYGAWNQPPGTWSDDSSLTFCLAESLLKGYDLNDIGQKFVKWMKEGYWGAHYKVFDIGGTTRISLDRIYKGEDPRFSGEFEEESNGNGSLMRIMPAALFFHKLSDDLLLERIREVSSITHMHFRSVFSCFIYSKFTSHILAGKDKHDALVQMIKDVNGIIERNKFSDNEIILFQNILSGNLESMDEDDIHSSGYVLHTLEASLWCFLKTNSFSDAVLRAVNLGGDTDTTGCVTGALAGLYYGINDIPSEWINVLARKNDIIDLAKNFNKVIN
ncbi:MAG TPA: ADP-ribosylglycohydrolase family protein [Cyclobacteriaceae bacterium]|nr:ADP-ribosylglycohydrolase family protein [Cyclobacteriaceae bacterium]